MSTICCALTDRGTSRTIRYGSVCRPTLCPNRALIKDEINWAKVSFTFDPPRGPAHDEALPELRILRDEPLVERSDGPPRGQVDHSVRLHIRNHRDVLEEVRQGLGAPAESAVPGPEEPELAELRDDLVEVHALQVAKRPTPTHRRVCRVERSEPLRHRDGNELVREDGAVVLPDHEVLELFGQGPPGNRRRLRDILLGGREDHAVPGLADPVTGATDPLDEEGDFSRGVVLGHA